MNNGETSKKCGKYKQVPTVKHNNNSNQALFYQAGI